MLVLGLTLFWGGYLIVRCYNSLSTWGKSSALYREDVCVETGRPWCMKALHSVGVKLTFHCGTVMRRVDWVSHYAVLSVLEMLSKLRGDYARCRTVRS